MYSESITLQSQPKEKYGVRLIKGELKKKRWYEFETKILWNNAIFIIIIHVLGLYYTITFPYLDHKILTVWGNYNHYSTLQLYLSISEKLK